MKQEAKISVIVPVYGVERYISDCIRSLCDQTWKNLEILLIDDGSKDGSGKICDEWAKKDSRIRVFHVENGGQSRARNIGMKEASGDYIGFVGARFDGVVGNILTCGICGVTGVIIYAIMIFVTGEDDIKSIIKKKG